MQDSRHVAGKPFRSTILLAVLLLAPSFAAAKPLTLDFTGAWHHYDPVFWSPDFHAAMAGVGVDNGTPIFWSLFIDDVDLNPDPARSTYSVFRSELSFGALSLISGPSTLTQEGGLGGWSMLFMETMGAPVEGFRPGYLQLTANSPEPGVCHLWGDGFETPIGVMDRLGGYIGFRGISGGLFLGDTGLTYVSPVPEPEIYAMLGVGLGLLGWVGRRKRAQDAARLEPC
jgi:PEP-CTERM motif-containing protein